VTCFSIDLDIDKHGGGTFSGAQPGIAGDRERVDALGDDIGAES
jgi:hypothetical protein